MRFLLPRRWNGKNAWYFGYPVSLLGCECWSQKHWAPQFRAHRLGHTKTLWIPFHVSSGKQFQHYLFGRAPTLYPSSCPRQTSRFQSQKRCRKSCHGLETETRSTKLQGLQNKIQGPAQTQICHSNWTPSHLFPLQPSMKNYQWQWYLNEKSSEKFSMWLMDGGERFSAIIATEVSSLIFVPNCCKAL